MTTHELAAAYADADLHALGEIDRSALTVEALEAALDHAISADLAGVRRPRWSQAGLATVRRDGRAVR